MLDRTERCTFLEDPRNIAAAIGGAVFHEHRVALQQLSAGVWQGKAPEAGFGYSIKLSLVVTPLGDGYPTPAGHIPFMLAIRSEVDLEDKAVVLLFVLPIMLIVGPWLYFQAQKRQRELFDTVSRVIAPFVRPPNALHGGPAGMIGGGYGWRP